MLKLLSDTSSPFTFEYSVIVRPKPGWSLNSSSSSLAFVVRAAPLFSEPLEPLGESFGYRSSSKTRFWSGGLRTMPARASFLVVANSLSDG